MDDLRKKITLKVSHPELVWLIEKMLEAGNFEELLKNQIEDAEVQKVLERIAISHDNIDMRCKAIKQIRNISILNEITKKSYSYRIIGDEAQARIQSLKE